MRKKMMESMIQKVVDVSKSLKPKQKLLSCTQCEFSCKFQKNLEGHVYSKHENKMPFNCTFCEYKTSYELSLRRHIKLEHEKFIEFKCKTCDVSTPSKRSLRLHLEFCDGSSNSNPSTRYGGDYQDGTVKGSEENLGMVSSQFDVGQSLPDGGNEA